MHPCLGIFAPTLPCAEHSFLPVIAWLMSTLPSRSHSAPPPHLPPSLGGDSHSLRGLRVFITALGLAMCISSLDGELLKASPLCPPDKAMCFTHDRHATDACPAALRAGSQRRQTPLYSDTLGKSLSGPLRRLRHSFPPSLVPASSQCP